MPGRERQAAEAVWVELAKAQLRLKALPKLENDEDRLRMELEHELRARTEAEKFAAVAQAKIRSAQARAERVEKLEQMARVGA